MGLGYDPETKTQSSQWKHSISPRPKRQGTCGATSIFFDSCGVVHHEYVPQGQNINKEYYLEVLRRLRDAMRRKRPDLWAAGTWQLHHDNAPAHSSQLIQTFLVKHNIPVVRQASYSPDMAPCYYWLFPHLKTQLKGTRFESQDDIFAENNNAMRAAYKISITRWLHITDAVYWREKIHVCA